MNRRSGPWPELAVALICGCILVIGAAFVLNQFRGSF